MINKKKNMVINICLTILSIGCFWLVMDIINNYNYKYNMVEIIVIFIFSSYYVSVSIHELTHFFAFKFFSMPMRAICFFPFCFINNRDGWEARINLNYIGLGGAAVPNQVVINNEADYLRVKKAFAYSMLAAPIASIVIMIIGVILMIIEYAIFRNEALEILGSFFTLINFIIVSGCFTRNENVSGDFFAFRYILENDDMALLLIYSYRKISLSYSEIITNDYYLRDKLIKCFEKRCHNNKTDLDALSIATGFINECLVYNKEIPICILDYINYVYSNAENFNKIKNTEAFKRFIVRVSYFFKYTGKYEESFKIYEYYIMNFPNRAVDKYRKMQAEQIIKGKDNVKFLSDKKNIKPDTLYSFYRIFNEYFVDEIAINNLDI